MAATYLDEVLADAPSGLWRLDEAAGVYADLSGNGNDLTVTGAVTRGVVGPVLNYNAAEFHGGWAYVPQAAVLDPTTGITQEAWVFLPTGWNSFWGVVSKTIGDLAGTKAQIHINSAGQVNMTISTTVTNGTAQTSAALSTNTYHHVMGTWDGSNIRIFIDGVQQPIASNANQNTYPLSGTIQTGSGKLYVGATAGGTFNPNAGGRLQYAAQYSTALTAARAMAHFNAQNNPATPHTPTPANGTNNNPLGTTTLAWVAEGATSYDLYFGSTNPPPLYAANLAAAAYAPPLNAGTIYYWQVVAKAGATNPGDNAGPVWTFQVAQAANPSFGLIHPFQMAPTGNANAALIDDTKWNAAHKAPAFLVLCAADQLAIQWANQPAAETSWRSGFPYPHAICDFKYATQARFIVNVSAAGAAGAQLRVKVAPLATGVFQYPDAVNGFAVLIDAVGLKDSGWINLSNPTITAGDVEATLFGFGGDGIASPSFGLIALYVR